MSLTSKLHQIITTRVPSTVVVCVCLWVERGFLRAGPPFLSHLVRGTSPLCPDLGNNRPSLGQGPPRLFGLGSPAARHFCSLTLPGLAPSVLECVQGREGLLGEAQDCPLELRVLFSFLFRVQPSVYFFQTSLPVTSDRDLSIKTSFLSCSWGADEAVSEQKCVWRGRSTSL